MRNSTVTSSATIYHGGEVNTPLAGAEQPYRRLGPAATVSRRQQPGLIAILAEWHRPTHTDGAAWTCSRCGEKLGSQFSKCWKCGTKRDAAP